MTDQATYTREQIALDDARFTMRAHRLTYSVVQTRLREAALEEAADQVAHLEERIATLAPVNSADSRRVMALTAEVDQLHALALAGELGSGAHDADPGDGGDWRAGASTRGRSRHRRDADGTRAGVREHAAP